MLKDKSKVTIKSLGNHVRLKHGSILKLIFAGHDMNYKGAKNEEYGFAEFSEALKIIDCLLYKIDNCNMNNGFYFPQKTWEFNSLTKKVDFINKVCKDESIEKGKIKIIAIEIHFNSALFGDNYKIGGIETLHCKRSIEGRKLANCIQKSLLERLPFRDRKVKSRNDLYFLNKTICPAIIIETCFINNNLEISYLLHPRGRLLIAKSIFEGIEKYGKNIINK